jgi:hypothetical protein
MDVEWVLVPVPEEFEPEISAYLMRLRMSDLIPPWDLESATEHVARLDDEQRRALRFAVRAVVDRAPTTLGALAAHLGTSEREAAGLVRELNLTRVPPARGDIVFLSPPPEEELRVMLPIADIFAQAGV